MEFDLQLKIFIEIVIAMLFGGIVGLERELAKKPAGLRTHMLVAGAAAFLISLGDIIVLEYAAREFSGIAGTDPIRIIQAIIIGISFLGAGTIIQRRREERIEGLTTSASILFTSAIGICVALEQYYLAGAVTILVFIVNFFLLIIEKWLKTKYADEN